MKPRTKLLSIMVATLFALSLFGCAEQKDEKPNFSGYRDVAELATLECYYHNVAEIINDGRPLPFGINLSYKKVWFEYRGSVIIGIDVSRVDISEPDENGVVTITLPPAEIMGTPNVDETSISELYTDQGLLATITAEEQTEAFKYAQEAMLEQANSDESLRSQATERAKVLLEEYVRNVGEAIGQSYTVRFEMLPA